jgi:hypothetical protein
MAEGVVNKHVKGGWIIVKYNGAGGFVKANHSNALNGANSAGETVTRMNIVSAEWSIGGANNAYWEVKRGANTVLVLTNGQHCFDFSDSRLIDNYGGEPQANIVVTKIGSGPGHITLKVHKTTSIAGGSEY